MCEMLQRLIYLFGICFLGNQLAKTIFAICVFKYPLPFGLFYVESVPCRQIGKKRVVYILQFAQENVNFFTSFVQQKYLYCTDRTDNEKRRNSYENESDSILFLLVIDLLLIKDHTLISRTIPPYYSETWTQTWL